MIRPADSGCLEDCLKAGFDFDDCYIFCQRHSIFDREEFLRDREDE